MSYLDTYVDLALPIPAEERAITITEDEVERLTKLLAVARLAQSIPRRLGAEASAEQLAEDSRRGKRIAHVASQLLTSWGGDPGVSPGDVGREAATVNWDRWWEEHQVWLVNRQRYLATWCHKSSQNGDLRWCKSAMVRLENEIKWLAYAMR